MTIGISDLTSNVQTDEDNIVTGDGAFDKLMETVTAHVDAQHQLGRITGADYATVYLGALQATVQQATAFLLGKEKTNTEVSLLGQKEITEFAQTIQTTKVAPDSESVMGKQITLYGEQAKGFLNNAKNKHLQTLANMWNINVSTAGVASTGVDAINSTGVDNINDQIESAEPL